MSAYLLNLARRGAGLPPLAPLRPAMPPHAAPDMGWEAPERQPAPAEGAFGQAAMGHAEAPQAPQAVAPAPITAPQPSSPAPRPLQYALPATRGPELRPLHTPSPTASARSAPSEPEDLQERPSPVPRPRPPVAAFHPVEQAEPDAYQRAILPDEPDRPSPEQAQPAIEPATVYRPTPEPLLQTPVAETPVVEPPVVVRPTPDVYGRPPVPAMPAAPAAQIRPVAESMPALSVLAIPPQPATESRLVQVRIGTIEVRATRPPERPPGCAPEPQGFAAYTAIRTYRGWEDG